MAYVPKFLSRPFQGLMAVGNGVWNGDFTVPKWSIGAATENKEDLPALNGNLKRKVSGQAARVDKRRGKIEEAYRKLGVDPAGLYDADGNVDQDKVESAFRDVSDRLAAAGVDVGAGADIVKMADAYDKLDDSGKKKFASWTRGETSSEEPGASGIVPRNGTAKAPASGAENPPQTPNGSVPLRPRGVPQADIATETRWGRTGTSDTGVRVNGAPVEAGDTITRDNIRSQQRSATASDALEASEALKDAQTRAKSGDRRRAQQYMADQDALDASLEERSKRKEAERQAKEQARRDKRFKDRKLVNKDDWENLGREGGNKFDYSDEGNADAKKAHDTNAAKLRDRLARLSDKTLIKEGETAEWKDGKMVVTDKDGNIVDATNRTTTGVGDDGLRYVNMLYSYDPARQRDLAGLRKLVEKGFQDGTLTDAQIEGAVKTLDSWESGALSRKNAQDGREQMRQAEQMRSLRSQYGMEDKEVYDDATVRAYHDRIQSDRRKEILGRMSANGAATKPGEYGDSWQQLLDAGFDPRKTFKAAIGNADVAKSYDAARMKIDTDATLSDTAKAEMRDQLKHRTIMEQAFRDAGIDSQPADIGAVRRGRVGSAPSDDYQTTVAQNVQEEMMPAQAPQPKQPQQLPQALTPRKSKKDDEVGASLGGDALPLLRPRRRA